MSSFILFIFCFLGGVAFLERSVSLSFPLLNGEYLVRYPSGYGIFLPRDHRLDFDNSLCENSVNEKITVTTKIVGRRKGAAADTAAITRSAKKRSSLTTAAPTKQGVTGGLIPDIHHAHSPFKGLETRIPTIADNDYDALLLPGECTVSRK